MTTESITSRKPGYSCLFLNTYYDGFLQSMYGRNPGLLTATYDIQKQALQAEMFGDSDFYSTGLRTAGWRAADLIVNCAPLLAAWARENGVEGASLAIALEQIRREKPDVLYVQDMHLLTADFLEAVRPHIRLLVGQIGSPVGSTIPFGSYDIVFSCVPYYVDNLRASGVTAYYQSLAFDGRVNAEVDILPFLDRKVNCSFIGGMSTYHVQAYRLLELLAEKTPLSAWGYGCDTLPENSPVRARHHGEAWGKEMFSILGTSRVTVNRHGEIAENYACNMRLFEATGCGALLITDHKDNLNDLFEIGKEVVSYRSPEECAALVNYYLSHPDEAERIARAGQERTLREHTYSKRMEQTAEILERHLRYRDEKGAPNPDISRVSYGHTAIGETDVSKSMTTAWQDAAIPAKQRALVRQALDGMYRGDKMPAYEALANIIRSRVPTGASVLEIGCSSGYCYEMLEYLMKKRIAYTGIDYSEAMIAMARDYYPQTRFFTADGANLFFADRCFHTVISSCVLLHVPNYREHIFETARVADHFVVASRTPVCRRGPTRYLKKFAYEVETVEILFNEEEIIREFVLNGLKLVDAIEYHSDHARDEYQVTYLFKRRQ